MVCVVMVMIMVVIMSIRCLGFGFSQHFLNLTFKAFAMDRDAAIFRSTGRNAMREMRVSCFILADSWRN